MRLLILLLAILVVPTASMLRPIENLPETIGQSLDVGFPQNRPRQAAAGPIESSPGTPNGTGFPFAYRVGERGQIHQREETGRDGSDRHHRLAGDGLEVGAQDLVAAADGGEARGQNR